jgi:outer membrane receptor protein involved in Fe transport
VGTFGSEILRARILASVSVGALCVALAAAGAPAFAQNNGQGAAPPVAQTPAAEDENAEGEAAERVVVTGSRIVRQDFTANSPIVTVDQDTFENTSTIGIETILNQLPQFIPAATTQTGGSQFSSGSLEGNSRQTPGASSVNLRGLGSNRNLILVDGRRAMSTNASGVVDTNSIPSSAIQRVEIISGGASAVYGADAIAGVVNFILKDDFEGIDIDTNYGVTEYGDGTEFRISTLFGANSADGRGNVMLGLEHSSRGAADAAERDWRLEELENPYRGGTDFWFSETWWTAPTSASTAPSQAAVNAAFSNLPAGAIPRTSTRFFINPGSDNLFTGGRLLTGANGVAGSVNYEGPIDGFQPGDVEYRDGFPYRVVMYDGSIKQNQEVANLTVPLDRYSAFGRAHYDITDSISAFARGTFSRTRTTTVSQPASAVTINDVRIPYGDNDIWADSFADKTAYNATTNPDGALLGYDPVTGKPIWRTTAPTAAAYLPGGGFGLNCPALGGCSESDVFPLPQELRDILNSRPAASRNNDIDLERATDFLGTRSTHTRNMTFQLMFGLEGTLANDWTWDASLSHGQTEVLTRYDGFLSMERYRAIARWPNFGRGFVMTANQQEGGVRGGTGTCTTGLALVEDFEVSQDCLDAIDTRMKQTGELEQNIFEANLAGDLFELPAGPLQFAAGATYRETEYVFKADGINSPSTFNDSVIGLAPTGDTKAALDVSEVYAELLVPIIKDGPLGVREFNLELGGRYSDYSASGGVETYKVLGDWTITDWARLRGGYNRATRAPNIAELYLGRTLLVFDVTGTQGDPCSLNNYVHPYSAVTVPRPSDGRAPPASPEQAAQTRAICEALMGASTDAYYGRDVADMNGGTGGVGNAIFRGNPDVDPETADTFTAGLVVSSPLNNPWLSGLNASVDWYKIELNDIISNESGNLVQERCFSLAENPTGDVNNPFCQRMLRNISNGEPLSMDITTTNEGRAELSGVDLQVNWRAQFDDLGLQAIPGGVGVNVLATFPIQFDTYVTDTANAIDWVGHQGGSCLDLSCTVYEYQVFTTFNYIVGPLSTSLRWQHYPDIESSTAATNPNTTIRGVLKSYDVFALSGSYRLNDTVTLRAGVENLFDTPPALQGGDPNSTTPTSWLPSRAGGGIYDPLGRRYFVGVAATF